MNKIERLSIDSDLLLTFVEIAESRTLTLAAAKLSRTQSAISVQLRKLEDGLGAELFTRTAKGMVLTAAGETLLSRAKPILDELRQTALLFQNPLQGTLSIGFPDDFDDAVLERILARFARAHPAVKVLARSGCTSRYDEAIQSGELDIAVCSGLAHPGPYLLNTDAVVWAASDGFVWSGSEEIALALLDRPCHWRDMPMKALDKAGVPYRIAFQSSSFTSLQSALRAGIAIGLLPKSSVGSGLRILTEKDGMPKLPLSYRSILKSDSGPDDLLDAMEDAIRHAVLPEVS